jgi:hypothetical protein
MNLYIAPGTRERTITVHLDRVTAADGGRLDGIPIQICRSPRGAVETGEVVVAFSEPPALEAQPVASDQGRGSLVWKAEPGDYFIFFGWTRPTVRVAPEDISATVIYTVIVE